MAHSLRQLHQLPSGVRQNIREYASDRVQQHPIAQLIKSLNFIRDDLAEHCPFNDGYPSLFVHGGITKRMRKCNNTACWMCLTHDGSCANAQDITRPVAYRRYIITDFTEPDRYMEDYRMMRLNYY